MAKEIIEAEIKSNVGKFADDAERAAEAVDKISKSSDVATKRYRTVIRFISNTKRCF